MVTSSAIKQTKRRPQWNTTSCPLILKFLSTLQLRGREDSNAAERLNWFPSVCSSRPNPWSLGQRVQLWKPAEVHGGVHTVSLSRSLETERIPLVWPPESWRGRGEVNQESKTVYLSKTQANLKLMDGKEIAPVSRPGAGGGAHLGNSLAS